MPDCRLAAEEIACRRGDRVLFARLCFALAPGEALQVAGANGSGKSSLIRIVAGLLAPDAGQIERSGAIGLVDERPALDTHLPLSRALELWQRIDGAADNEAARLGLTTLMEVPVRYLSTGQKKRAALARLIGQQAQIWLLDEPLNGLDSKGVALVVELAAEHCREGGICLIASHQPFALPGLERIELTQFLPSPSGRGRSEARDSERGWGSPAGLEPPPQPLPAGEGL